MLENDALLAKVSIIKNCLVSIEKYTELKIESLANQLIQDAVVLNLERAIQACIDTANIVISREGLKLPTSYKESFQILETNKIISQKTSALLQKMTGFRNIAVHEYQEINLEILKKIVSDHLIDFDQFNLEIAQYLKK